MPKRPPSDNDATTIMPRRSEPAEADATEPRRADQTMAVTQSMMLPVGVGETMALTPDMVVNDASIIMAPAQVERAIAVVKLWHTAVNAGDADTLAATCAEDIELIGPRGSSRGHAVIREWLARAKFSATAQRWFCGGDGHVVVAQQATWRERDGEVTGTIASAFVVRDGKIRRYERFDELATALTMYGLREVHEDTQRR
jgi:ketosteroid isomerase-like protein